MKKLKIVKISLGFSIAIICIWLFAVFLRINSTECGDLTDIEAREMIQRVLENKYHNSDTGKILFENNYESIAFSSIKRSKGATEADNSIDLMYLDNISNKIIFTAAIFPSCEIQWIKTSN